MEPKQKVLACSNTCNDCCERRIKKIISKMIEEDLIDAKKDTKFDFVNAKIDQEISQIIHTAKQYPNYNNVCILNQKATRLMNLKLEKQEEKCVSFETGCYMKEY